MDYFDRLVRRALASAETQPQPLFDPFEQVAPWALDAAQVQAVRAQAARVEAPQRAPEVHAAEARPLAAARSSVQALKPSLQAPATQPVQTAMPMSATPALAADAVPGVPMPAPLPTPAPSPLAQADTFMRSLRAVVEPVDVPAPALRRSASPGDEPWLAPTEAPLPRLARTAPPEEPAAVRPHKPAEPPAAVPPPVPRTASVPPAAVARASTSPMRDKAAPVPPAAPTVHTTIVVAPPARRLDDLAHSSAIARFGLGQL